MSTEIYKAPSSKVADSSLPRRPVLDWIVLLYLSIALYHVSYSMFQYGKSLQSEPIPFIVFLFILLPSLLRLYSAYALYKLSKTAIYAIVGSIFTYILTFVVVDIYYGNFADIVNTIVNIPVEQKLDIALLIGCFIVVLFANKHRRLK